MKAEAVLATLMLLPTLVCVVALGLRAHTSRRRQIVAGQALRYLQQALLDDADASASYR